MNVVGGIAGGTGRRMTGRGLERGLFGRVDARRVRAQGTAGLRAGVLWGVLPPHGRCSRRGEPAVSNGDIQPGKGKSAQAESCRDRRRMAARGEAAGQGRPGHVDGRTGR